MRYKVLLTGKNDSVIDDFFTQVTDKFEVITTSPRFEDIMRHLTYFSPDIFVYCLNAEARNDIIQIINTKYKLSQANIPLVVIGLKEECDEFEKIAVNIANLILYRPLTMGTIQEKLIDLLKERRFLEVVNTQSERESAAPAAQKPSPGFQKAPEPPSFGKEQPRIRSTAPLQRRHVLVVDDNAMMLKVLKEHLHEKYDVATAVSGRVALKFLERKKTDLILLDYEMPDESGPVILEKLRAADETKDIPVIFLTGVTETKKIKEALALKPQNYLLKPIEREKLLDTIEKTIG